MRNLFSTMLILLFYYIFIFFVFLQAFENYQVQPMTNEFIESFGYDEANVDETENLK